ncbi:MAG: hypothetical protein QOJ46_2694 [bacterium]|jgi:hypothetical protein
MRTPTFARGLLTAAAAALAGLALVPATGLAAQVTFGSDLSAPANISQARQADTAYWQTTFADGHSPVAPGNGQITSFRLKGIALANPVPGVIGGETMFHLQALKPQPDGTFLVLRTSGAFFVAPKGTDPQTITTYNPINFCIETGEVLVFNTVGGWDGIVNQSGPYPSGTPLQIFSRIPNSAVSEFEGANQTNNGNYLTASTAKTSGTELLMQMTLSSGPDATPLCPGGTMGVPNAPPPPPPGPPAPPPTVQKATLPAKQKVTVSKKGKLSVSLFCLPGASRCVGKVRVMTTSATPKQIGSGSFNIGPKSTGHSTIFLTKTGRALFKAGGGKLAAKLVAETNPGGPTRTSTLATTLRKR